jgi:hypothetical protein
MFANQVSRSRTGCGRRRLSPELLLVFMCLAGSVQTRASTYQVGSARPYSSLAQLPVLKPGDVVEIDPGLYREVKRWTSPGTPAQPILIRGAGDTRPVFDAAGLNVDGSLPHPRAVFQVETHNLILENLEFRNATNGNNGAGIRITSGNNVTVRNCRISLCDMGVMCDNNSNLVIEASEICSNGTSLYNGYSHNFYLGGNSVSVRFCYIHDALYGQNFKSRAHFNELYGNFIADSQDGEVGLVDAAETAAMNSHALMIGNIVVSKPRLSGYNTGRFIQFGQDSGGQHNGTLFAFNNDFVAGDGRIQFLSANASGASLVVRNNLFFGSEKIAGSVGAGIIGANNWVPSTAAVPAGVLDSLQGTDPGLLDRPGRNFNLAASSACRDRGTSELVYLDAEGTTRRAWVAAEYWAPAGSRSRFQDPALDIGAYEYEPPRISRMQIGAGGCLIDFTSVAGNRYDLLRSDGLSAGGWAGVVTNLLGTGGVLQANDTNGGGQSSRFYRVRALK